MTNRRLPVVRRLRAPRPLEQGEAVIRSGSMRRTTSLVFIWVVAVILYYHSRDGLQHVTLLVGGVILAQGALTVVVGICRERWAWRITNQRLETGLLSRPRGSVHRWLTLERIGRIEVVALGDPHARAVLKALPTVRNELLQRIVGRPRAVVLAHRIDSDPKSTQVIACRTCAEAETIGAELRALVEQARRPTENLA